jgi:hypothetical protein
LKDPEAAVIHGFVTLARYILSESHQDYDLLLVGRSGISKIKNNAPGSVASKIVEVVVHPSIIVVGTNPESKKIRIAIDRSPGSMEALQNAGKLLDPAEYGNILN